MPLQIYPYFMEESLFLLQRAQGKCPVCPRLRYRDVPEVWLCQFVGWSIWGARMWGEYYAQIPLVVLLFVQLCFW